MYRVWPRPRMWAGLTRLKRQSSSGAAEPFLSGSSGAYVEQMYEAWKQNPSSVHKVRTHTCTPLSYSLFLVWLYKNCTMMKRRVKKFYCKGLKHKLSYGSILEYRIPNLIICTHPTLAFETLLFKLHYVQYSFHFSLGMHSFAMQLRGQDLVKRTLPLPLFPLLEEPHTPSTLQCPCQISLSIWMCRCVCVLHVNISVHMGS